MAEQSLNKSEIAGRRLELPAADPYGSETMAFSQDFILNNQPHIIISSLDLARLERLLDTQPEDQLPATRALEQELERAEVRDPEEMPADVVTMNSEVRFRLAPSGEEFCLTLVYPKDLNGRADRISILAPVGSALLGLAVGDKMSWPAPGGKQLEVQIIEIIYQPERDGEFHR